MRRGAYIHLARNTIQIQLCEYFLPGTCTHCCLRRAGVPPGSRWGYRRGDEEQKEWLYPACWGGGLGEETSPRPPPQGSSHSASPHPFPPRGSVERKILIFRRKIWEMGKVRRQEDHGRRGRQTHRRRGEGPQRDRPGSLQIRSGGAGLRAWVLKPHVGPGDAPPGSREASEHHLSESAVRSAVKYGVSVCSACYRRVPPAGAGLDDRRSSLPVLGAGHARRAGRFQVLVCRRLSSGLCPYTVGKGEKLFTLGSLL